MNSNLNLVANFSQDASKFAFQASISQKNTVDIYPLDTRNGYEVNSSLVNHIMYENNDLKASEITFLGWCSDSTGSESRTKRKHGDEEIEEENKENGQENYFINSFPEGQIVVFSSNGKDIVNIFRNKKDLIGIDTEGSNIWILDSEKCVKKLEYNQTKPAKTFHLIDGKDEEITNFEVLKVDDKIYLSLITETVVYIIDPTKRRPITVAKFENFGSLTCKLSVDGKFLIVADIESLKVFDFKTQDLVQSWKVQAEKIKIIEDYIFALIVGGKIVVHRLGESGIINTIKVAQSEAIEFAEVNGNILVAWLNVNEPNFKLISLDNINGNSEIIINEQSVINEESEQEKIEDGEEEKVEEQEEAVPKSPKKTKLVKAEENEMSLGLLAALENKLSENEILDLLTSDRWNEQRIIKFISTKVNTDDILTLLFNIISNELKRNVWNDVDSLTCWMKWLVTQKNIPYQVKHDKNMRKDYKHMKAALKSSSETLPVLLGMQGRLEMLIRQAKLREELANLALEDDSKDVNVIENGEGEGEGEDAISYLNGESDVFVDASEFR